MTTLNDYQHSHVLASGTEPKTENPRIRVVVIDDHKVTLDGLVAGLSFESDMTVVGFSTTFDSGFSLVTRLKPDVLLLDLHLPDAPGPRSMVKRFVEASDARIIIFSAETRSPFVKAVLDVGARGYLFKSEGVKKVAEAIRSIYKENKIVLSDALRSAPDVTKSEAEILKMLARGMKYDDIAARRKSSPATVRKQCEVLLLKLTLSNREQLIAWAVQNGYRTLELDQ